MATAVQERAPPETEAPRKVIVTGPGRSGTSVLMKLLTHLGFDTGFGLDDDVDPRTGAGFEEAPNIVDDYLTFVGVQDGLKIFKGDPEQWRRMYASRGRILKGPPYAVYLKTIAQAGHLKVEHLIVPVRDLNETTKSRLRVGLKWMADDYYSQLIVHHVALAKCVEAAVLLNIPITFMAYPRFCEEICYCHERLSRVFDLPIDFPEVFNEVMRRGPDG
jgi:hypothetical protein